MSSVCIQVPRKLQDTTLEAFDEILNDGMLEAMQKKALTLVLRNPDLTARELLQIGVSEGVYTNADRNIIAPRLTMMANEIIIVRPQKRRCAVTGRRVFTHRIAPDSWRFRRRALWESRPDKKYMLNMSTHRSDSHPGVYHTTVMWTDWTVTCTCNDFYHRPQEYSCRHRDGMLLAAGMLGKEKGAAE